MSRITVNGRLLSSRSVRTSSFLRRSIAPALLVLACALGGMVSFADEQHAGAATTTVPPAGASPAAAPTLGTGTRGAELRAVRTFPAARAERIAVDSINERLRAVNEDGDRIVLEAKSLRGLPATAELRWDQSSKDGGWILYEPVAPVSSSSPGGVASQGSK